MKVGWRRVAIGEIAEVKGGKRVPKGSKLQDEQTAHPYISVADFTDSGSVSTENMRYLSSDVFRLIKNYTISADDLYISIAGTIGKCGIIPPSLDGANLTENACKLVFRPGICKEFVYYFTQSESFISQALSSTRTAAQPKLALERLKGIRLDVPPLPEQQRIVAILDEAFAAIATAKANAEKNLQNARALFVSGMEEAVAAAATESPIVPLALLATDITDGDHLPPPKSASGVPFVTISNIDKQTNNLDFSDTFMVSTDYYQNLKANRKPQRGDVLFTVTGSFGIPVVVDYDTQFCFQRHIALVRPNRETDSLWLYYLLLSPQVFRQAAERATGTAQKTVSLKVLREIAVPLLPKAAQRVAAEKLRTLSDKTQLLESIYRRKLAALDELKKSLLHRAFNGDL